MKLGKIAAKALALLSILCFSLSSEAKVFSGQLELPENVGLQSFTSMNVRLDVLDENRNFLQSVSQNVTIPQNETSIAFSLDVDVGDGEIAVLTYSCFSCLDFGVSNRGYYASAGSVFSIEDAEDLSSIDTSNLNFTLLNARIFSGTLSRYEGADTSEALLVDVTLSAFDESGRLLQSNSDYLNLLSDQASADFSVALPPIEAAEYKLSYSCIGCGVYRGYYREDGATIDVDLATPFLGAQDQHSLEFVMVRPFILSGIASRPATSDISSNINLRISATSVNTIDGSISESFKSVSILENSDSNTFLLEVSPDPRFVYRVGYYCEHNCEGVAKSGFVGTETSVADVRSAKEFMVGEDVSNIALPLIEPRLVSGSISRAPGVNQLDQIFGTVTLRVLDQDGNFVDQEYDDFTILANEQSGSFEVETTPLSDVEYTLSYNCYSCSGNVRFGWYNGIGTVLEEQDASRISLGEDFSQIAMTMLKPFKISGQLNKPAGYISSSTLFASIELTVLRRDGSYFPTPVYRESLSIDPDSQFASFDILVPPFPDTTFQLSYNCALCDGIEGPGYYSNSGTAPRESESERVPLIQDLSGLSIDLIEADYVSGLILRPTNMSPDQELSIEVQLETIGFEDGEERRSTRDAYFVIPSGQTSVAYSIPAPLDYPATYTIAYNNCNCYGVEAIRNVAFRDAPPDLQFQFDDAFDGRDIQLELESDLQELVSGRLLRAAEKTDDLLDLSVTIESFSKEYLRIDEQTVSILFGAGETKVDFEVSVDKGAVYRVFYECFGCENLGFVRSGVLSESGETVASTPQNSFVLPSLLKNLTLDLLTPFNVKGSLSAPADDPLGISIFTVGLYQVFDNGSIGTSTGINQRLNFNSGGRLESFELMATPASKIEGTKAYIIGYQCNCNNRISRGYYTGNGTTTDPYKAIQFSGEVSQSDINLSILQTATISGEVIRPPGLDDSDELRVRVEYQAVTEQGNFLSAGAVNVDIPAGSNDVPFSLRSSSGSNAIYTVQAHYFGPNTSVAGVSYYTEFGSSPTRQGADSLSQEELSGLRLYLLNSQELKVNLARPPQASIDAPITVMLSFFDGFFRRDLGSHTISPGEHEISADISVVIKNSESFQLQYDCIDCPQDIASIGFYNRSGSVPRRSQGERLQIDGLQSEVELDLIYASEIFGELVRTDSHAGIDYSCVVRAYSPLTIIDAIFSKSKTIEFPSTHDRVTYSLSVPANSNTDFVVEYSCAIASDPRDYNGYFNTSGTRQSIDVAELLSISQLEQIPEFPMLSQQAVSGVVRRDASDDASEELRVRVSALRANFVGADIFASESIVLERGVTEVPYQLLLPENEEFIISLGSACIGFCVDNPLTRGGYYNPIGTVAKISDATILRSSESLSNIDLSLRYLDRQALTVLRPDGVGVESAYFLNIVTSERLQGGFLSPIKREFVEIPAGESEAQVEFLIDPLADIVVEYECALECRGAFPRGFYAASGSVISETAAGSINGNLLSTTRFQMLASKNVQVEVVTPLGFDRERPIAISVSALITEGDTVSELVQPLVLASGEVAGSFVVDLPILDNASYSFKVSCVRGCNDVSFDSFYSEVASRLNIADASHYSITELPSNLIIDLIVDKVIRGSLNRPENVESDVSLNLSVAAVHSDLSASYSTLVFIPRGSASSDFQIVVPDVSVPSFITVNCSGACQSGGVALPTFVGDLGEVFFRDQAALINLNEATDFFSIDLAAGVSVHLQLSQPVGVSLPDDQEVTVIVETLGLGNIVLDSIESTRKLQQVLMLDQLATFDIAVTTVGRNGFRIRYQCDGCDGVEPEAYISSVGSTLMATAEQFDFRKDLFLFSRMLGTDAIDDDSDGVSNQIDNCPQVANSLQSNFDNDRFGDLCDLDSDNDGVVDAQDAMIFDRRLCGDTDGDLCDDCSSRSYNPLLDGVDTDRDGFCDLGDLDDDGDGIPDQDDNCPTVNHDGGNPQSCGVTTDNDQLCIPLFTKSERLTIICL